MDSNQFVFFIIYIFIVFKRFRSAHFYKLMDKSLQRGARYRRLDNPRQLIRLNWHVKRCSLKRKDVIIWTNIHGRIVAASLVIGHFLQFCTAKMLKLPPVLRASLQNE